MSSDSKYNQILQTGSCPSVELLKLYQQGKLSDAERFEVERHLTECEICNDLLEGFSVFTNAEEFAQAESEIRKHVHSILYQNKDKKGRLVISRRWSIAAGIAILVSVGGLWWIKSQSFGNKELAKAEKMEESASSEIMPVDSIKPMTLADNNIKEVSKPVTMESKKPIKTKDTRIEYIESEYQEAMLAEEQPAYQDTQYTVEANGAGQVTMATQVIAARVEIQETKSDSVSPAIAEMLQGKVSGVSVSKSGKKERREVKTISGRITDENGDPLPGASVMLKETTQGTVTNMNGEFQLNLTDSANTLIASMIGYETQEIATSKNQPIITQLEPSTVALSEVVVVGYADQPRKMTTGSISVVKMEEDKSYDPEAARRHILEEINELKNASDFNSNWKKVKKVTIKYLQVEEPDNALIYLEKLKTLLTSTENASALKEVENLINQQKLGKAIRKLRRIEME